MRRSTVTLLILAAFLLNLAGCGDPRQAKIVPVDGKISFADGKPLPKGTRLIFNPAEGNMGTATGETDESGMFKVVHNSGRNGAGVGKYTVQIMAPEGQGAEFYKVVSRAYFDNGGLLAVEVKEGMESLKLAVKKQ